jgi:outer membrane protein OmpA-like peptidoglycan-associated protein
LADDDQNIWFGTKSSGLYVTEFGLKTSSLSAINIMDLSIDCEGNASADISIKISGGKAPFKLDWSDPGFSGMDLKDVSAGAYGLTVTDADGQSTDQEITVANEEPLFAEVKNTVRVSKAGFSDGQASVEITGGQYPYTVRWDSNEKGPSAKKLSAGSHLVRITDSNGCTTEANFEIEKSKIIPDLDIAKVSVGQTLRINQLYFAADSSNISSQSFEVLGEIYNFLSVNDNVRVEIGGHTNNIPSHEYCDQLSEARAKSIANHLYEKGIPEGRLSFKGYGKRNPVSSNRTADGRRKNQRVELKILEIL